VKTIISLEGEPAMKQKLHIYALGTVVAISLAAGPQYASAAPTKAPAPPPPPPSHSITKYLDLSSPKISMLVTVLASML
jgi:hypothetical protein